MFLKPNVQRVPWIRELRHRQHSGQVRVQAVRLRLPKEFPFLGSLQLLHQGNEREGSPETNPEKIWSTGSGSKLIIFCFKVEKWFTMLGLGNGVFHLGTYMLWNSMIDDRGISFWRLSLPGQYVLGTYLVTPNWQTPKCISPLSMYWLPIVGNVIPYMKSKHVNMARISS